MLMNPTYWVLLTTCVLCGLAAASNPTDSVVMTYPVPEDVPPADDYRVWVDGREIFVYANPVAALASFDFSGSVQVVVETTRDVKWVDIRPMARNIKPDLTATGFRFTLNEPGPLSIELNGESLNHPLFLFANPVESNAPGAAADRVHYFGPGVHTPGRIDLQSGETVYLAGGAVLESSLVARDASNVTIRGRGILDATRLRLLPPAQRTNVIRLENCDDVLIEGITLSNATGWQIVLLNCHNVTIRNVKIISNNEPDDGVDIVSSRNILLTDCFIHTKDDCIAIKGWHGTDYPQPRPRNGV